MQTEKIVLIPPTHEISTPSFHVASELCSRFMAFLEEAGIQIAQPPVPVSDSLQDVRVEAGTPLPRLEELRLRFLDRQGLSPRAA